MFNESLNNATVRQWVDSVGKKKQKAPSTKPNQKVSCWAAGWEIFVSTLILCWVEPLSPRIHQVSQHTLSLSSTFCLPMNNGNLLHIDQFLMLVGKKNHVEYRR